MKPLINFIMNKNSGIGNSNEDSFNKSAFVFDSMLKEMEIGKNKKKNDKQFLLEGKQQNHSMYKMDFDYVLSKIDPQIQSIFANEISIAKTNFEKRFNQPKNESPRRKYLYSVYERDDWNKIINESLGLTTIQQLYPDKNTVVIQRFAYQNHEPVRGLSFSTDNDNRHRVKNFRLFTLICNLIYDPLFTITLLDQLDLFDRISKDLDTELKKKDHKNCKFEGIIDSDDEMDLKPNIVYRFGNSLKTVFQGYEVKHVCQLVYIVANILTRELTISLQGQKIEVSMAKTIKRFLLLQELIERLERIFEFNFISMFRRLQGKPTILGRPPRYDEYMTSLEFSRKEMLNTIIEEVNFLISKELDSSKYALEIEQEPLLTWLVLNLLHEEYFPYIFCMKHFQETLLDLISLSQFNNRRYNLEAFTFFRAESLNNPDSLKDIEEYPLSLFNKFTHYRKYKELKYDAIAICEILRSELLGQNQSMIEMMRNANLKSDLIRDSSLVTDYHQYKKDNVDFCRSIKDILRKYLHLELSIDSVRVLNQFLNSKSHIFGIKKRDQSNLVSKFHILNTRLYDALEGMKVPCPDLYKGRWEVELSLEMMEQSDKILQISHGCYHLSELRLKKIHLRYSSEVIKSLQTKVLEEKEILTNTICFENLNLYFVQLKSKIDDLLKEHNEQKLNVDTPSGLRFQKDNNGHLLLPQPLRNEAKPFRRMRPEIVLETAPWEYLKSMIGQLHWKVQNGLVTWFTLFILHFPYRLTVVKFLKSLELQKVNSRITAIKFFGIVSKLFKLIEECKNILGHEKYFESKEWCQVASEIPPSVFIDLDTTFGFSDLKLDEDPKWDTDFFNHLHTWLNRDTRERLFNIEVTKDFELSMSQMFLDMKTVSSKYHKSDTTRTIINLNENYFLEKNSIIFGLRNIFFEKHKRYFFKNNENFFKNSFVYNPFSKFCANFFNFSAQGSAQSVSVGLRETEEILQQKEENLKIYEEILRKSKRINGNSGNSNNKSVTKTICFAITGEYLPKILYWVSGKKYSPRLNLSIKKEQKKLRHVINADLTSFVKQTYIHDLLTCSLSETTKKKFISLLTTDERVSVFHRMIYTHDNEKWNVPIDMKDFHHHFGKSHYRSFVTNLRESVPDFITCPYIREDVNHILKTMSSELSNGVVNYRLNSPDRNLFSVYDKEKHNCVVVRYEDKDEIERGKDFRSDEDFPLSEVGYSLRFDVENGLMSGWKMTSFFGSLFNLTLNNMSEFFNSVFSNDIIQNLNVLGDDTHFKRRYLSSSLNHISFMNMLGKVAHPDKQLVSTVSTEFLKRNVNCVQKYISYSNLRTITSLLFFKESSKKTQIDANYIKDNFDLWNLFLTRIDDKDLRKNIVDKRYFYSFFESLMNIKDSSANIKAVLCSPTYINGFLAGPLRELTIDFRTTGNFNIRDHVKQYKVKSCIKILELNVVPGNCKGIVSNVSKIIGNLQKEMGSLDYKKLHSRLISLETEEIMDSRGEYIDYEEDQSKDKRNTKISFESISEKIEGVVYKADSEVFNVESFIEYAFVFIEMVIVQRVKLSGITGELIYHNEKISRLICETLIDLKTLDFNFRSIVKSLTSLMKRNNLEVGLTNHFVQRYGQMAFLELALSNKESVSISRNYLHDEFLGFLNENLSRILLFYIMEYLPKCNIMKVIQNINITLDYYLHQNQQMISERLKEILYKKIEHCLE